MKNLKNNEYDAVLFDMDNTLTRSKSLIAPEVFLALADLNRKVPIVIVSGQVKERILRQIPWLDLLPNAYILAQNGNDALSVRGKQLWRETFSPAAREDVLAHIKRVSAFGGYRVNAETLEERGCQIAFSLYGHNAPIEEKEKVDPDRSVRKNILKRIPFESQYAEVSIGGTTTFDYTEKGRNKGDNVGRITQMHGWKNPLYIGDALFPGGNDASVIGVCATRQVENPKETLRVVKKLCGTREKIVAVSGYFNPIHKGHLNMFRAARALGDRLVVILNNDEQVRLKGSVPFMSQEERAEVVLALQDVDEVMVSVDTDKSVCHTLQQIKPHIFANGGDRRSAADIPEAAVCEEYNIEMVFNVGGEKAQSSSWLIKDAAERTKLGAK